MKTARTVPLSVVAAAALLASAFALPAAAAAPAGGAPHGGTPTTSCSAAEFDSATVQRDPSSGSTTLIVTGVKRSSNVSIELTPVVYIRQPEYWLILVNGCGSGMGMPVLTPYVVKRDITGSIGTLGIEVRGSNQAVTIPIARPERETHSERA